MAPLAMGMEAREVSRGLSPLHGYAGHELEGSHCSSTLPAPPFCPSAPQGHSTPSVFCKGSISVLPSQALPGPNPGTEELHGPCAVSLTPDCGRLKYGIYPSEIQTAKWVQTSPHHALQTTLWM